AVGATCKRNRDAVKASIEYFTITAGQVILAEDAISDLPIDYVCELRGGVDPYTIHNQAMPKAGKIARKWTDRQALIEYACEII
ncbi:hypothetical protein, partial [Leifsonia sp. SIMBA_070]|uniref:hypothetical protein n=1 Tax=Leifsonia sp. SIMBA_070 TaxID=3085810 RepID=UPI00397E72D4